MLLHVMRSAYRVSSHESFLNRLDFLFQPARYQQQCVFCFLTTCMQQSIGVTSRLTTGRYCLTLIGPDIHLHPVDSMQRSGHGHEACHRQGTSIHIALTREMCSSGDIHGKAY